MFTHLEIAREGVADAGREGAWDVVPDQMSPADAWQGKPCSSTSSRLLALSSSSMLLPAKLHTKAQTDR